MFMKLSAKKWLILSLIIAVGASPIYIYWFTTGQYAISPDKAKLLLNSNNSNTVLIDVRSAEEFQENHIDGAQNWSSEKIYETAALDQIPQKFQGKMLLLICNAGVSSNYALKHLKNIGLENIKSVRGGMQEWIADGTCSANCIFNQFKSDENVGEFPTRESPYYEQLLQVITGFVVKPAYTVLAMIVAIILWRKQEHDLIALKWSMIFFFIGENFCALNYLLFADRSYLSEYLHGFGMLLAFSFVTYAVFEGFDSRILHLSAADKKCAAMGLCKKCIKYENVPCGLKSTFYLIIPAMAIIALMPLLADWRTTSYNTVVLGKSYNYSHLVVYQEYERLFCPLLAITLLSVSFLILLFKKENAISSAKLFFAAGFGPLGFGMMRTMLGGFYGENLVWSNVWEEGTEFLFIAGVCCVIWIFKRGLLESRSAQ